MSSWNDNREIEIFREYLRIPSVHPDIDYGGYKKQFRIKDDEFVALGSSSVARRAI